MPSDYKPGHVTEALDRVHVLQCVIEEFFEHVVLGMYRDKHLRISHMLSELYDEIIDLEDQPSN